MPYLIRRRWTQSCVAFVSGDAGDGKTALINAFIHQAMAKDSRLTAAAGTCSAHVGIGDPYHLSATFCGASLATWRHTSTGYTLSPRTRAPSRGPVPNRYDSLALLWPDSLDICSLPKRWCNERNCTSRAMAKRLISTNSATWFGAKSPQEM